jgi:tetratricopeptide (TPR) repeat protein
MGRVDKTVFISYRRTNFPWAQAIYANLSQAGFNVFFDYKSIASGDFEQIILGSIRARAHFLVLLTPSALERCDNPDDWLRREIETALDEKRNIVPLFLEGFSFGSPSIARYLTGKLENLKKYNGLNVPAEYFDDAMRRLREKFLNVALDTVIHPVSTTIQVEVAKQQVAASSAPKVSAKQLTAQQWFERRYKSADLEEEIYSLTEAILLEPDFPEAYYNRGKTFYKKGLLAEAIRDYTEALRLKRDYMEAYNGRIDAHRAMGDWDGLIQDYTEAIRQMPDLADRLKPDLADAYNSRGNAAKARLDAVKIDRYSYSRVIEDYTEAIRLKPDFVEAYYNRGNARNVKGDRKGAIQDYTEATRLKPDFAEAYYQRGLVRQHERDLDGAIKDFTLAIRLEPYFAVAYWARGSAWYEKRDYFSAVADYQKYFEAGGNDEDNKIYLELARKKLGKE